MAKIHPFKGVRPTRDKAQLVSTKPLSAYRKHVLRAKLDENPFTFLHIIHPDGDPDHLKSGSDDRLKAVKNEFERFLNQGILIQDEYPSYYIYKQSKETRQFVGIICGASLEEYKNGEIKKHEATLTNREEMFTNFLDVVGINVEPVLLAHEPNDSISQIISEITSERPEYEFSTTDSLKHELWVIPNNQNKRLETEFDNVKTMYIADGHHRSASSLRLLDKKGVNASLNQRYFLAYLIAEDSLEILAFHRLVKHLGGNTEDSFFEKCTQYFNLQEIDELEKPRSEHEIIAYTRHRIVSLKLKEEFLDDSQIVKSLDPQIIFDFILKPILGIHDLKTSKDIDYLPETTPMKELVQKIRESQYEICFLMHPLQFNHIQKVADNEEIMPPKSTWIEPKLRSGLTIYKMAE